MVYLGMTGSQTPLGGTFSSQEPRPHTGRALHRGDAPAPHHHIAGHNSTPRIPQTHRAGCRAESKCHKK